MATQTSSVKSSAAKSTYEADPLPLNGRLAWHSSAPRNIAKAGSWLDESKGWEAWLEHLGSRLQPKPLSRLLSAKSSPLAWCAAEIEGSNALDDRLDLLHRLGRGKAVSAAGLETAVEEFLDSDEDTAAAALECIAWTHALAPLSQRTRAETWWKVLGHLFEKCCEADQIKLDQTPLEHQLFAGELRLALSYNLPEIKTVRGLVTPARRALSEGPDYLLDGEGLPHAALLPLLRPLLACWTRCVAMGQTLKHGCWNEPADIQYAWLIRQAMRLTRRDGTQALSHNGDGGWPVDLFQAAMDLDGDREDRAIARLALPIRKKASSKKTRKKKLPPAANNSEWAELAVLRPAWSHGEGVLTVDYSQPEMQIELSLGSHTLLFGSAQLEIWGDEKPLKQDSSWESVCWESDKDVDYLELETTFGKDVRVQRQLLFAREDRFLFLADALLTKSPCKLRYQANWPVDSGTALSPHKRSREVTITAGKPRAEVLPLALPEWRRDLRVGELEAKGDSLQLSQVIEGHGLYAPLFIDLDPRRRGRPVTWRQLTVAEDRKIMSPDEAVGYRVQVGKKQWLIYRSLGERGNRSVLGENLISEFQMSRFDGNGSTEQLLEIE